MGNSIIDEFKFSLSDLQENSRMHINLLTSLAQEYVEFAKDVVKAIHEHVNETSPDTKLPCLYLIDSILKNVGDSYVPVFSRHIVHIFTSVFEKVDERTRAQMYKLRITWNNIFPSKVLYVLDAKTKQVDPAWPMIAQAPPPNIRINPKFIGKPVTTDTILSPAQTLPSVIQNEKDVLKVQQKIILKQLLEKQRQIKILEEKKRLSKSRSEQQPPAVPSNATVASTAEVNPTTTHVTTSTTHVTTSTTHVTMSTTRVTTSTAHVTTSTTSVNGSSPANTNLKFSGKSSQVSASDIQKSVQIQTTVPTSQRLVVKPVQNIPQNVTVRPVVLNPRDPRQRDPRRAAIINQLVSQQPAAFSSTSPASSVATSGGTTETPFVVKVKPVILHETNSSPKESPLKGEKEIPNSTESSEKKSESTVNSSSESIEPKSDEQIPTSVQCEADSTVQKDKPVTGTNGKKLKEQKLPNSDAQRPLLNNTKSRTSSIKHSNEKSSEKKKISPKNKTSCSHTQRSQTERKKRTRQRSRSPAHRVGRRSPKTQRRNHDTRRRRQSTTPSTKKLDGNLQNDVDLQPPRNYMDEKCLKGTKRDIDKEKKENAVEPPEKKTKEDKENADVKNSLFGNEDKDYRQLAKSQSKGAFEGWATYKKAHPDEFKIPKLRQSRGSIDSNYSASEDCRNDGEKISSPSPRKLFNPNEMEYDRLGRPRLHKMRQFQRSDPGYMYPRRNGNVPFNQESHSDHLRHFLRDPKDILRQAEERYRLGIISSVDFNGIQRDLENMSRSLPKLEECGLSRPLQHCGNMEDIPYFRHGNSKFRNGPDHAYNNSRHFPPNQERNIKGSNIPLPAVSTITLDQKLRQIHFVDDKAFVFMDNGEPREITFDGKPTEVRIGGLKPILLGFDGKPVELELTGTVHSMKFGVPSRELYIDDCPYEGKFGGPPFAVTLENGRVYSVSLAGPQPIVRVSDQPAVELYQKYLNQNCNDPNKRLQPNAVTRNDGNWRRMDHRYNAQGDHRNDIEQKLFNKLDNSYRINNQAWQQLRPAKWNHSRFQGVQMGNGLHNTLPHGESPYPVNWNQYGCSQQLNSEQMSKSVNLPWTSRNLGPVGPRFSRPAMPENNFNPQRRNDIQEFEGKQRYASNCVKSEGPRDFGQPFRAPFNIRPFRPEFNDKSAIRPALPPPPHSISSRQCPQGIIPLENTGHPASLPSIHLPTHMEEIIIKQEVHIDATLPITLSSIPLSNTSLTSIAPSNLPPLIPDNLSTVSAEVPKPVGVPALSQPIDIKSLFAKLLDIGIISHPPSDGSKVSSSVENKKNTEHKEPSVKKEKESVEHIPPIKLILESLKVKQPGIINYLHSGSQCVSCGMRFKEIQSEKYSRHLDWHFRMNRREKDGVKKAFSRKWYYEVEDWIQFEEFEDLDERARNFFDLEANQQFEVEPTIEVPSVPASGQENEICVVCNEPFCLFWLEEEEEWHLRNAVRHDEQAYHPSCYEDHIKVSRKPETPVEEIASIDVIKEEDVKKESIDEDVKVELVCDIDIKKEPDDEAVNIQIENEIKEEVLQLVHVLVEAVISKEEENRRKEEMRIKEMMQGKPGEEEIIGLITESDIETEDVQKEESEKVVFKSGGIIMKVRAESIKPASPSGIATAEKETCLKRTEESNDEEFRPPTPDPRFQVLPLVQKGTELSGLCCIM